MKFRLSTSSVFTGCSPMPVGNAARPSISSLYWARGARRKLDQQTVVCQRHFLACLRCKAHRSRVTSVAVQFIRKSTFSTKGCMQRLIFSLFAFCFHIHCFIIFISVREVTMIKSHRGQLCVHRVNIIAYRHAARAVHL